MVDLGAIGLTTYPLRTIGNYSQSAQLYFQAGSINESSELFVYAAWQFGEENHIDSALISIKRAINFGMNSPYILDKVSIEKESKTSVLRPENR